MLTIMSSRARRPRRPLAAVPPPATPPPAGADTAGVSIQALVERIHAGELDAELPVLAAAIAERQQLLAAAHALITRASLRAGDRCASTTTPGRCTCTATPARSPASTARASSCAWTSPSGASSPESYGAPHWPWIG